MELVLSVIVPAYNGAKTIKKAVDSLLCQTIKDFEVIIVNDGSKDDTAAIADEYAASDERVRVVHKPVNEGLSAGRNSGMAVARGKYITFLDCDDWVEPDMYEVMLRQGQDADVIVTGAFHDVLDADGNVAVCTEDAVGESCVVHDRSEVINWAARLDRRRLFAYTWNKLYRREFLGECGTTFQNQTLIEDYQFNCGIWGKVQKLALVDGCYYHYIKFSKEALTQRYLPDYFDIMDKRYELMRTLFSANELFAGESREVICMMHIKHIIAGMVKNCSARSGLSNAQQRVQIRSVLNDANCAEAMRFAKGARTQEKACAAVFCTKSVLMNHGFAKLLYWMQNSRGSLFDKLK